MRDQIVAQIHEQQSLPGRKTATTPAAPNVGALSRWKARDIGFFTPDPTSTTHIKIIRGIIYYFNVYAFLGVLRAYISLKSEEVIGANLPSCLRDTALMSLEKGWFARLERRFKPHATVAQANALADIAAMHALSPSRYY